MKRGKTMKKRFALFLMLAMLIALAVAGCGKSEDTAATDQADDTDASADTGADEEKGTDFDLLEDGKLTFAMSGLYKPFNYKEGGELKGFDVEIGNALSEAMGLEPNPVTTPWESIVQSLKGKKFDAVIGSMAYTDERAKEVAFSKPYYLSGGQIFVGKGNDEIKSVDDLKGKRIGVVPQSTYYDAAKEYTDDIKNYNGDVTALTDLTVEGRLDAVITAPVIGFEAMNAGLEIEPAGDALWIEQASVAVRLEDKELLDAINAAIDTIVEDGTYDKISNDMFGRNLLDMKTEGIPVLK